MVSGGQGVLLIETRMSMSDENLIYNYLSGKATPEEKAALTGWVRAHPDNLRRYRQLRNIWQVAHPAFNPAEIGLEEARTTVMKQIATVPWYRTALIYWQRTAAVLVLPLFILTAWLMLDNGTGEAEIVSYQQVFAPYGTYSKVNLPDGTVAWLNAGSTLEFPTVFRKGERLVRLAGEGYFEVESDTGNPFVVRTNMMDVKATGTAFNVEAYEKDSVMAVTMVKGKIAVAIGNAQPFNVVPGERMLYNLNTTGCRINKTEPYKWCAWKDGLMVFRDDPLGEVFKRIGQTFNVDIVIRDADIARHLYRATFEDESLDEILRLLKLTAPIHFKKFERNQSSAGIYNRQRIEVYKSTGLGE